MKKYKIPEEIHDIFCEYQSLEILKESYVKQYFGYKKSKRCTIDAFKARAKFWNKVFNLYPNLVDKNLIYDANSRNIEVVVKNAK